MELHEVITVTEEHYFDAPTSALVNEILFPGTYPAPDDPLVTPDTIKAVTPKKILVPTGEVFHSQQEFRAHVRKTNGSKYSGRTWKLTGARGESPEIIIKETRQYSFEVGGKS